MISPGQKPVFVRLKYEHTFDIMGSSRGPGESETVAMSQAIPLYNPRHVIGSLHDVSTEVLRPEEPWSLEYLAGRLVELEAGGNAAALTLACKVIIDAQQCGEPVAWITAADDRSGVFYPPDVYDNGVDLAALPVVRVPETIAAFSAADLLLRSAGFGLIVTDLGAPQAVAATVLARLAGLARRHRTALLFLTRPSGERPLSPTGVRTTADDATYAGSLGSLISLHVRCLRQRTGPDRFRCGLVALKDKHRGPGWQYTELCRGASGLR